MSIMNETGDSYCWRRVSDDVYLRICGTGCSPNNCLRKRFFPYEDIHIYLFEFKMLSCEFHRNDAFALA